MKKLVSFHPITLQIYRIKYGFRPLQVIVQAAFVPLGHVNVVIVVVVYFSVSTLLCLAYSANLGLLYRLHPGMGPLV